MAAGCRPLLRPSGAFESQPSTAAALTGTTAEIAAGIAAHAAAGTSHLIVALEPTIPESVRRLREAVDVARVGGGSAAGPPGGTAGATVRTG